MKNNSFLTLLFLILATNSVFSQKTLAPGLQPYAENWSYNVKRLLNRAGFDLPAASVDKAASRSPLQLDSTKTFYGYDLNTPGDSTPLFRTTYQYTSPNEKKEAEYEWINNAWLPLSRTTITSDDQQRIVTAIAEAYDPESETFKPDSRLENYPHGNSQDLIDSFLVYGWDTVAQDWLLLLATYNTFDAQDRILESVSTFDYFGTPLLFKDVYSYDANGDNHLIEESAVFDGFDIPSGRTEITYVDHLPIEVTTFVSDGVAFYPTNRENYAYTLFGALRLAMSFQRDEANDEWDMTQRVEYGFDGEQRVASKETTFINPGAWDERELVTYAYVEDENLAQERLHHWDDDLFDWILDNKKYYYYNGLVSTPSIPSALALQVAPNPTTDVVRLMLDEEAAVRVFDAAGQLVQSRLMQPGQVLDMTALPAGIYSVTAQNGAQLYTGKVAKQ